jgi:hypothetical protein
VAGEYGFGRSIRRGRLLTFRIAPVSLLAASSAANLEVLTDCPEGCTTAMLYSSLEVAGMKITESGL